MVGIWFMPPSSGRPSGEPPLSKIARRFERAGIGKDEWAFGGGAAISLLLKGEVLGRGRRGEGRSPPRTMGDIEVYVADRDPFIGTADFHHRFLGDEGSDWKIELLRQSYFDFIAPEKEDIAEVSWKGRVYPVLSPEFILTNLLSRALDREKNKKDVVKLAKRLEIDFERVYSLLEKVGFDRFVSREEVGSIAEFLGKKGWQGIIAGRIWEAFRNDDIWFGGLKFSDVYQLARVEAGGLAKHVWELFELVAGKMREKIDYEGITAREDKKLEESEVNNSLRIAIALFFRHLRLSERSEQLCRDLLNQTYWDNRFASGYEGTTTYAVAIAARVNRLLGMLKELVENGVEEASERIACTFVSSPGLLHPLFSEFRAKIGEYGKGGEGKSLLEHLDIEGTVQKCGEETEIDLGTR